MMSQKLEKVLLELQHFTRFENTIGKQRSCRFLPCGELECKLTVIACIYLLTYSCLTSVSTVPYILLPT